MRGLTFLLLAMFLAMPCSMGESTTVFLVRHAEKQAGSEDPGLTEDGQVRAQQLASALRSIKLSACFASQFKRTQQTAAPSAKVMEIEVTERKAGKEEALAEEIRKDFVGKAVLFVGHSNTVPKLMKHLGAANVPKLEESDYDNLFVLQIDESGKATVMQLHYGASAAR